MLLTTVPVATAALSRGAVAAQMSPKITKITITYVPKIIGDLALSTTSFESFVLRLIINF